MAVSTCLGSSFPIVIWWGRDLILLYNDAYTSILGNKHPKALGQRGEECWGEVWALVGPMLERVLDEGKPFTADDLQLMVWRHGYFEECYFYFSYSPIYEEDGGVSGVFCPVIETTEKIIGARRLETLRELAALRRAETVREACQQAIAVLAKNGRDVPFAFLYLLSDDVASASLMGATDGTGESVEIPLAQFTEWPIADALEEPCVLENLDGKHLPAGGWTEPPRQAYLAPVILPGSRKARAAIVIGISPHKRLDQAYHSFLQLLVSQVGSTIADTLAYEAERKRAEALAELDRAKTAFFSNVSHEFRTPLTLMLGPLERALSSGDRVPPQLREEITTAHRNALRLLKLVNTLLDFSRIEAGRIQASYEPVNISSFTAELASNFRSAVERTGMRLVIECPSLPEPVWIDCEMSEKIVLNLLSNAFKFTFEGEIAVRVLQAAANCVQLVVSDTGTGIAQGDLPHIFERFHRIRGVRARSHEGSGIGLALVLELVKLHGGTIAATSTLGKGTAFTVHIPTGSAHLPQDRIAAPRAAASTAIGAAPFVEEALRWLPGPHDETAQDRDSLTETEPHIQRSKSVVDPAPGGKILFADDNADMRDYVQRLLAGLYDVEMATDGESALRAARERTPDLILTDIMMPGMDGLELLRALRADCRMSQIPVILLSARAGEESKVEGLDAGADDYLVKPFTARELLARVKSHLHLAKERRRFAQELGARLTELEQANAEIRDGRRAALNLLEDAVEARERAEQLYRELLASEKRFAQIAGQRPVASGAQKRKPS
jgi:signal transduction histidine kinase/DNA-binding response OmpR family regulator